MAARFKFASASLRWIIVIAALLLIATFALLMNTVEHSHAAGVHHTAKTTVNATSTPASTSGVGGMVPDWFLGH